VRRTRWLVLIPVLVLLAVLAWQFWPRPAPFPYEGVNDPPSGRPAAKVKKPPRDAGVPDARP
jgi:hypothetical protein